MLTSKVSVKTIILYITEIFNSWINKWSAPLIVLNYDRQRAAIEESLRSYTINLLMVITK